MRSPLDVVDQYRWVVRSAAVALAILASVGPFVPPYSILGWTGQATIVAPVEHWWYGLPTGWRTQEIYLITTRAALLVYPTLVAIFFVLWMPAGGRAVTPFPRRNAILMYAGATASATYFVVSWHYAMRYQGLTYTCICLLVNIGVLLAVLAMWLRGRRSGSWWWSLAAHWIFAAWICLGAFPWLGEML